MEAPTLSVQTAADPSQLAALPSLAVPPVQARSGALQAARLGSLTNSTGVLAGQGGEHQIGKQLVSQL